MTKFFALTTRVVGGLACWGLLAGLTLAQGPDGSAPADVHSNPACWPAPCEAPCGPNATRDFDYYLTPPRPALYVETDGAAIQRRPQSTVNYATLGNTGNVALSSSNFDYDFQAAGRLLVGWTLNECWQVEGLYTAVATSESDYAVRSTTTNLLGGTGNLFSPFGNFGASPIAGLDFMNFAEINYTSSFQGAEVNFRRTMPMPPGRLNMSVLCGIRYNDISEQFNFNTTTTTPAPQGGVNNFHVATDNQMVGGQIGALFDLYIENRWWLDFEIKGVVYSNRAKLTSAYHNVDNNGVATDFVFSDQEVHTGFAEDLSLVLLYRWSPHMTTRLGYQALFMQDVALAANNLATDINVIKLGPAIVNHTDSIIYHGPVAGVTIAW